MDLSLVARQMFVDVIAPAMVALVLLLLPRRNAGEAGTSTRPLLDWRGPIALALAYVTSHLLAEGWVGFPPRNALNWLTVMIAVAGIVGVVDGAWQRPKWGTLPLRIALVGAMLWFVLQSPIQWTWTETSQDVMWLSAFGVGTLVILCALNTGRVGATSRTFVVMMGIVLALTAVSLALTGSVRLAQRAGAGAAALGGILLAGVLPGGSVRTVGRGIATVFVIMLVGLVLNGYYTSELPAAAAILLACAPATLLIARLWPRQDASSTDRRRSWMMATASVLGATIMAGIATGFAVADHLEVQAADSETDEYDPYADFSPDN